MISNKKKELSYKRAVHSPIITNDSDEEGIYNVVQTNSVPSASKNKSKNNKGSASHASTSIIDVYNESKTRDTLTNKYLNYQYDFEKKYGKTTAIFMEVGDFYELYSVNNEVEKIGNLKEIADICDIKITHKNNKYASNNTSLLTAYDNHRDNVLMCGFPSYVLKKYLELLLDNNYTVIIINQDDYDKKCREITNIYTAGTYINNDTKIETNNIISIVIQSGTCMKTHNKYFICGMSIIDLTTGKSTVYETNAFLYDKIGLFEEIYRFIESYNPREMIIHMRDDINITEQELLKEININQCIGGPCNNGILIHNNIYNINEFKLSYCEQFLNMIFQHNSPISLLESFDLVNIQNARISYTILLKYAYEHNKSIISKLDKPVYWEYNDHLIMYHNAIYQLNIMRTPLSLESKKKYKSLFDIINNTMTPMGHRYLKYNLLNPITNINILQSRYDNINVLICARQDLQNINTNTNTGTNNIDKLDTYLSNIKDIERLIRRLKLEILQPYNLYYLMTSLINVREILNIDTIAQILSYKADELNNIITILSVFINEYLTIFNEQELLNNDNSKNNTNGTNFFNKGYDNDVDNIQQNIDNIHLFFNNECNRLSLNIKENSQGNCIKVEYSDIHGYYLSTTVTRANLLLKQHAIEQNDIKKQGSGQYIKIITNEISNQSNKLISLKQQLTSLIKQKYKQVINMFNNKYCNDNDKVIDSFAGNEVNYQLSMDTIINIITHIDYVNSGAKCALKFGYTCPIIKSFENNKSYINCTGMRHPIIERLDENEFYIENDIDLYNMRGILLYGINGVGKSSFAKAIGCNIVMAQIGYFVACKSFEYYPYNKIFTRINGDDNIFKGMSSFVVEMNELRSIIKYSDIYSIILGDEVCKGTEENSALAIVSASILRFAQRDINFIFATHFHKLASMDEIIKCNNINFKHLSVSFDNDKECMIYGRKLEDGPGIDTYGLEIARFIIKDVDFYNNALNIRNNLCNIHQIKSSHFNSDVIMIKCAICGNNTDQLDTHHIIEQHNFNSFNNVTKNQQSNLIVLCKTHHNDVHYGNLIINGYKRSSTGLIIDYYYTQQIDHISVHKEIQHINNNINNINNTNDINNTNNVIDDTTNTITNVVATKKKNKKFNDQDIININNLLKNHNKTTINNMLTYLELNGYKMSSSILNKILNNTY